MRRKHKTSSYERLKKVPVVTYLEPEQAVAVRALNARTRVAAQVYIREGVDLVLAKYGGGEEMRSEIVQRRLTGDPRVWCIDFTDAESKRHLEAVCDAAGNPMRELAKARQQELQEECYAVTYSAQAVPLRPPSTRRLLCL